MAKKTKHQLEYESWTRRLKAALINVEGAASLWGGCIAEAGDCELGSPESRFAQAMDEGIVRRDATVGDEIERRLWTLAQDMQEAIAKGEAGRKGSSDAD